MQTRVLLAISTKSFDQPIAWVRIAFTLLMLALAVSAAWKFVKHHQLKGPVETLAGVLVLTIIYHAVDPGYLDGAADVVRNFVNS